MITKHYCKSIVRAALLLALTMCIIGLSPAFSTSAQAYSINDVSGNYVDQVDGWLKILGNGNSPVNYSPLMGIGLVTFYPGTASFHADWTLRHDGENHSQIHDGTYTVDANGHGTMTWQDHHRDFYIVNGGAELKWTNTDAAGDFVMASIGTMTKQ